jgi:hypothetical protein
MDCDRDRRLDLGASTGSSRRGSQSNFQRRSFRLGGRRDLARGQSVAPLPWGSNAVLLALDTTSLGQPTGGAAPAGADHRSREVHRRRHFAGSTAGRTGRRDRGSPDHPKRDTVLAAVKAWPGGAGARRTVGATAILDGGCARRHWARAGRDEETVLRSNQETDQKEVGERRFNSRLTQHRAGASTASKPACRPHHEADNGARAERTETDVSAHGPRPCLDNRDSSPD